VCACFLSKRTPTKLVPGRHEDWPIGERIESAPGWIDGVEIVRARAPEVPEELARQVSKAVQNLRKMDLQKRPGVAETLDWARALDFLGAERLDANVTTATLGSVLKDRDDIDQVKNNMSGVIG